jgi:DNA-binding NarL/FixJ family response regulator
MGDPVYVGVMALDPILEAGAISALQGCPDLAVALPGEEARVIVVIVDAINCHVFELMRGLRDASHRSEVVLVAAELAAGEALHAIAAGARGLLRRHEASPARLERAVLAAASGDCTVSPDMLAELLQHGADVRTAGGPSGSWPGSGLSEREHAVLRLIADGRETDEIARELCFATRTVVGVVHDITQRFQLRNRAHAVAFAMRTGLL